MANGGREIPNMLCLTAHPPGAQTYDEHIRQVTIEKVWRKEHAIGKQGCPKKSLTIVAKKQGKKGVTADYVV